MDEYISKQSVIDYLEGYLNSIGECGADSLLFDRGQRRALINSIQDISVIKGEDIQSVKHGRWKIENHLNQDILFCTQCEKDINVLKYGSYYIKEFKFCPYCGARMDGESE